MWENHILEDVNTCVTSMQSGDIDTMDRYKRFDYKHCLSSEKVHKEKTHPTLDCELNMGLRLLNIKLFPKATLFLSRLYLSMF